MGRYREVRCALCEDTFQRHNMRPLMLFQSVLTEVGAELRRGPHYFCLECWGQMRERCIQERTRDGIAARQRV